MIGKNISYSLKTDKNGLPQLSYDIGNKILFEDKTHIKIELPTEIVTLSKSYYLNTHYGKRFVIYDNGQVFIALCTKHCRTEYVFDELMKYAISKIDLRIDKLQGGLQGTHQKQRISSRLINAPNQTIKRKRKPA